MIIFPSAIAWPASERDREREGEGGREGDCRIFGAGTWCRKRQHFSTYIENARFCFILRAKLKLFDLHFNECNISCSRNASLGLVPGAEGKEGRGERGGYNLNAYTGSERESGACSEFTDALTFELITMNAATQANAIVTVNVNVNMNQTGTHTHILYFTLAGLDTDWHHFALCESSSGCARGIHTWLRRAAC